MSQFVVNLGEPEKTAASPKEVVKTSSETAPQVKKRGGFARFLKISGIVLASLLVVGALVSYFYWQSVKRSPEYSLALLVDAARRNDQKAMDELVDTDAVVDSFLPQVTDKATELYGRNLPPEKIARVKEFSKPLLPAIKQRARAEVPRVIKEKTDRFASVPYWAIALGAPQFLDIKPSGDTAIITSKIPERPFELTMKKNGEFWRVVGIRDDALATRIAQTVGQELIAISSQEGLKKASEKLNAPGLDNIKKKVEDLFR